MSNKFDFVLNGSIKTTPKQERKFDDVDTSVENHLEVPEAVRRAEAARQMEEMRRAEEAKNAEIARQTAKAAEIARKAEAEQRADEIGITETIIIHRPSPVCNTSPAGTFGAKIFENYLNEFDRYGNKI